jgi:hypothetical protein
MTKSSPRKDTPLSSGIELSSGAELSSGMPSLSGGVRKDCSKPFSSGHETWEAFAIGEEVTQAAEIPFQLAPRLYLLSHSVSHQPASSESGSHCHHLDDLPRHLIFQESTSSDAARKRQIWVSEGDSHWKWELLIERYNGELQATLKVTPSTEDSQNGRPTWKNSGDWSPFARNSLAPECGTNDVPTLIVEAP